MKQILSILTLILASTPLWSQDDMPSFSFVHLGDPQIGFGPDGLAADVERFQIVSDRMKESNFVFALNVGDLVNKGSREETEAYRKLHAAFPIPMYVSPGNHDVGQAASYNLHKQKIFCERYGYKGNKETGEDWYVFRYQNCAFVSINTNTLQIDVEEFRRKLKEDPEKNAKLAAALGSAEAQWEWLEELLPRLHKDTSVTHIILFMHIPPFSKNENEPDGYYAFTPAARTRFLKLVRETGIRHILCGHTHKNFVIQPEDKAFTIYSIAGTSRVFNKQMGHGYGLYHVNGDEIRFEFVGINKEIEKAAPEK